jgi:excisionase family DNA binding protein
MDKLLLSIDEARTRLGLGRTLMWELVRRGEVPSVRVGRRRLVATVELERYVERLRDLEEGGWPLRNEL